MANLIHIYKDGVMISEGDNTNPIVVGPLNATIGEESVPMKLAIKCDTGFQSAGDTVITPQGENANKWALAPNNNGAAGTFGAYGASLTISDVIKQEDVIFWVKAKSDISETPSNDTSTKLTVQATIAAV